MEEPNTAREDVHSDTTPASGADPQPDAALKKKEKKKKKKARSVWISFTGRIIAQIMGAVASIYLGVYAVDKYSGKHSSTSAAALQATASLPKAVRVAEGESTLAVLPLQNFSGDPQQEYFVDGLTEELITDLAQTKGLRVVSRTSSMHYKGERKSLPEIAQELGVDWIVEGSAVRSAGRVRITAQLIDAKRDLHIWARSYDRTVHDVMALQGEIASSIANDVGGALSAAGQDNRTRGMAIDPAVYVLSPPGR